MERLVTVRDHHDRRHRVEIPEGWRRVRHGRIKPGDRYLDLMILTSLGCVAWDDVRQCDLHAKAGEPYGSAEWFGCVIRHDKPLCATKYGEEK